MFTLHDLEPTYPFQPAWLDNLAHYITANYSNRVIVHCCEARRLLAEKYGRSHNVFVVDHPNFIGWYPNTITKDIARKQLNLPSNAIVFAFFGGVRPNKGIETLIQAFLKLEESNFRLIIAGNVNRPATYAQYLQELAKEDERISFHSRHISDDEIQVFMNAADIVVLPFAKILTSGSAMLAMSFRRPVVIPTMGCLPELIEPVSGWQFEPNNSDSLAATMQIAATSDFQQAGQLAYSRVLPYSSEHFAEQTIRAYWDPSLK